jgi:hypothetical protein
LTEQPADDHAGAAQNPGGDISHVRLTDRR